MVKFLVAHISFIIKLLDKTNKKVEDYAILVASYGLSSLISLPTRVNNCSSTCTDHIFCRNSINSPINFSADVLQISITDHWMTFLGIHFRDKVKANKNNKCFEYSSVDLRKLKSLISGTSWNDVFTCSSVSHAFENFTLKVQNCVIASTKSVKI